MEKIRKVRIFKKILDPSHNQAIGNGENKNSNYKDCNFRKHIPKIHQCDSSIAMIVEKREESFFIVPENNVAVHLGKNMTRYKLFSVYVSVSNG